MRKRIKKYNIGKKIYLRNVLDQDRELHDQVILEQNPDTKQNSLDEQWNRVCTHKNRLVLVIVEKMTEAICGFCELKNLNTEFPVVGIFLFKEFRKKSYGEESLRLLFEYIQKRKENIQNYIYGVESSNTPSICLVEKLGGNLRAKEWVEKGIGGEDKYLLIYWIPVETQRNGEV